MKNYTLFAKVLCFGILFSVQTSVLGAQKSEKKQSKLKYYGTHIVTDIGSDFVGGMAIGAGLTPALLLGIAHAKGWIAENSVGSFVAGIGVYTSLMSGVTAAVIIKFKSPQWTDMYILKNSKKRTKSQNIISFFSRAILPNPLGTVVAEYLISESDDQK